MFNYIKSRYRTSKIQYYKIIITYSLPASLKTLLPTFVFTFLFLDLNNTTLSIRRPVPVVRTDLLSVLRHASGLRSELGGCTLWHLSCFHLAVTGTVRCFLLFIGLALAPMSYRGHSRVTGKA